jgi:hypothetical protein
MNHWRAFFGLAGVEERCGKKGKFTKKGLMAHVQTLGANDPFHYAVEQYLKQMHPQDN